MPGDKIKVSRSFSRFRTCGTQGLSVPTSLPGTTTQVLGKLCVPLPEGKETGQYYLFETAGFFLLVLFHKIFQRVFQPWERCNGPVEGRDVDLVNSFGVRGR